MTYAPEDFVQEMFVISSFIFAQEAKYQLLNHILDITQGKPASKYHKGFTRDN